MRELVNLSIGLWHKNLSDIKQKFEMQTETWFSGLKPCCKQA